VRPILGASQHQNRPLLRVRNLKTYYRLGDDWVRAVDDVSFDLSQGETLGIVGESGCGKSTLALSLLRILPSNAVIQDGQVLLDDIDLLRLGDRELRGVRWKQISMIFQGAMNSLNPVYRIRDMLKEALRVHEPASEAEMQARVQQVLELAGFPTGRAGSYPHELSGGMKQRAVIAMSLVCNPKIIVADEPTTALDVVVQDRILRRIQKIQRELALALVLVSHDAAIVAQVCDRVAVMYAGQIAEYAGVRDIFRNPRHPYTIGLMSSVPSLRGPVRPLASIPGVVQDLRLPFTGCRFADRCALVEDVCRREDPGLVEVAAGHWARCHFARDERVSRFQAAQLAAGRDGAAGRDEAPMSRTTHVPA
jgi:peptide/nickel transport system ATP-binding protein